MPQERHTARASGHTQLPALPAAGQKNSSWLPFPSRVLFLQDCVCNILTTSGDRTAPSPEAPLGPGCYFYRDKAVSRRCIYRLGSTVGWAGTPCLVTTAHFLVFLKQGLIIVALLSGCPGIHSLPATVTQGLGW